MKKIFYSLTLLIMLAGFTTTTFAQFYKNGRGKNNISRYAQIQKESVKFSRVNAFSDGNGVLIKWDTAFENENLGFDIYRIEGNQSVKVNRNIIPGSYLLSRYESKAGRDYSFFDPKGTFSSIYRIENISIGRKNHSSEIFFAKFVQTLEGLSNSSSEELQVAVRQSKPVLINRSPILPAELKKVVDESDALQDINTQRWLASQPGVKIGVNEEGLYRVTKAELQAAGFDTNTIPSNWQLYSGGVEQAILVEANGDYIEFYGKGVDTLDTDTNIYFLIAGDQPGVRMRTSISRGIGGTVIGKSYDFTYKKEDRSNYLPTVLNGVKPNFYGAIVSPSGSTINLDLDAIDLTAPEVKLFLSIQGLTFNSHRVEVEVNGQIVDTIIGSNKNLFSKEITLPTSLFQNGNNTLKVKGIDGASDISIMDDIIVDYKREYKAIDNQLSFYTQNLRITNLEGFTSSDIRVFDVTYGNFPTQVTTVTTTPDGSEFQVNLPSYRSRKMFAVADSAIKQVFSLVPNVPSTLATTTNQANLIIITNRAWLTEANAWATYRQNDGLTVKVIEVEDIYDEFGFGNNSANSIREFLSYAKTNWQISPGYCLLIGDASYDPKNHLGDGNHNYIPIRLVDTLYEETGSDEALADFDDNGLAEIAIGRIPARNPQDVTNALNKVIVFEQSVATAPSRGSLCASDEPRGYDFAGLCNRIQNELPASIPTSAINRLQPNAKTDLLNAMNSGKYLVNYSGHGSTAVWASSSFFGSDDVPTLTNQTDLTIYSMLTCLNGYFIRPVFDSLSEKLLKATNGGAVAVWSSTGETTPDIQEIMSRRFINQLGNNANMIRLGDLIKDAKSSFNGGRDVRLSWALLGDPTLKVK